MKRVSFDISTDKVVSEDELQELEELSGILSTYKDNVNLKRQVCLHLFTSFVSWKYFENFGEH